MAETTGMILAQRTELAKADILDAQPPQAQEAFQFLLATAMHKAGKFELLNVAEVDGQCRYTFRCSVRAKFRESD